MSDANDVTRDPYQSDQVERARALINAVPDHIGRYRILESIGGGGMGEVYRAEQRVPVRREVAIKLIKMGMDTKLVIARFEAERQALAMMDHPNIAKVYDADADETGRPYFVMEYVKGKPITEYADANHLTINERLKLFEQVCNAIQHAHHKGIIHRDLKPSNVLVSTQDGRPYAKIIDFGIAKATSQRLTDKTLYTQHDQFIGTPQYMSPEQADGSLDIDTRTDVYSLGVLLYELLTGTTPFSSNDIKLAAIDKIKQLIREVDPPKPSTRLSTNIDTLTTLAASRRVEPKKLGHIIRGELDWIVMKALEKDRARRYDTPTSMVEDVGRYLEGTPVLAAPPQWSYRASKFVRKYKIPIAAVSILFMALTAGIIGTSYGMRKAIVAKQAEEARFSLQQSAAAQATAAKDANDLEEYIADLAYVQSAIQSQNWQEVHRRLEACPVSKRGWEWNLLSSEAKPFTERINIPRFSSVLLSPDGSKIIALPPSDSREMKQSASVWDLEKNRLYCEPLAHEFTLRPVISWTTTADRVMTHDFQRDKTYRSRLWDVKTGKQISTVTHNHSHNVRLSPDGRRAWRQCASNGDLWDMESATEKKLGQTINVGEPESTFDTDNVNFTEDSKLLFAVMPKQVLLISAEDGNQLASIDIVAQENQMEFSKDGKLLAIFSGTSAQVYDARTGKTVGAPLKHSEDIKYQHFNPDGTKMFTTTKSAFHVWEIGSDVRIIRTVDLSDFVPLSTDIFARVNDDGTRLVIRLNDNEAILMDTESRTLLGQRMEFKNNFPWFDKSGDYLLALDPDGAFRVWDNEGLLVSVLRLAPGDDSVSAFFVDNSPHLVYPDRRMLIGARGALVNARLDVSDSPREVIEHDMASLLYPETPPQTVGTRKKPIATTRPNGEAALDFGDGDLKAIVASAINLQACAISPDGTRLVLADSDSVHFWDTVSRRELTSFKTLVSGIHKLRFAEDGQRLLIYGAMNRIEVWDTRPDAAGQKDRALHYKEAKAARKLVSELLTIDTTINTAMEKIAANSTLTPLRKVFAQEELKWQKGLVQNKVDAFMADFKTANGYYSELLNNPAKIPGQRLRAEVIGKIRSMTLRHTETWDRVIANDLPRSEYEFYYQKLKDGHSDDVEKNHNLNSMAYAMYRMSDHAGCIQTLMRREAIDPDNKNLPPGERRHIADWAFLAMAHFRTGDIDQAKSNLATFKKLYAETDETRKTRYKLLSIEAVNMIEPDMLEAFTTDHEALNQLAYQACNHADATQADYENALRAATLAGKLSGETPGYVNTIAIAQFRLRRFNESLETFKRAEEMYHGIESVPPRDFHWSFRSMAAFRSGKLDGAQRYFRKMLAEENSSVFGMTAMIRDEATNLVDPQKQLTPEPAEALEPTTVPATQPGNP